MTFEAERHYAPRVETEGGGADSRVHVVLPGEGWAFEGEEDVKAFRRELAARLRESGEGCAAAARALALAFIEAGRLERPCLHFIPAVTLRFQPSKTGLHGDRDVDFDLDMAGWTFRDGKAKADFDRRLNLLDSPVLADREAMVDNSFLDAVRDGVENLLLDVFDEGLVVPYGDTRLTVIL